MTGRAVMTTDLPFPKRRGKVRDVYDLDAVAPGMLLIVATDRISAFDVVLPDGIPGKGVILTQTALFWFERYHRHFANHVISGDVDAFPEQLREHREVLRGRSMLVRRAEVIPFECVARGYLAGSGWREYATSGTVCGIRLPAGLRNGDRLPAPIFTPATKAQEGHDENVPFETLVSALGLSLAEELREKTLRLYEMAARYAEGRGLILADTKFEWGRDGRGAGGAGGGESDPRLPPRRGAVSGGAGGGGAGGGGGGGVMLVDEILTPDSSRYWPADGWRPGGEQPSFDKQYVRDYLAGLSWDRTPPGPRLPEEVIRGTQRRYIEAYERLSGAKLDLGEWAL